KIAAHPYRHARRISELRDLCPRVVSGRATGVEQLRTADALHGRSGVRRAAGRSAARPARGAGGSRPRDRPRMTLPLSRSSELFEAECNADDVPGGAGLEALRIAPIWETLFLFPGGAGDPNELSAMVDAVDGCK